MRSAFAIIFIVLAVGIFALSQSVFMVDEREQALVLQLGQPVGDVKEPGLHFKIPVIQNVRRFDQRILSVDPQPTQMVVASSKRVRPNPAAEDENGEETEEALPVQEATSGEPIIVDTFARYRITDPLKFLKTLRTVREANQRLENIMSNSTRNALGRRTLPELLSPERSEVMEDIRQRVNAKITQDEMGIELIDIRIVRADLTAALRQSTVRRMISELRERATETRARGEERALEIRSTAEKDRTVILAEAERDSQIIRGEGDEESIKTYAAAFNKDKEFYAFIRSMEAYRNTLANPDTRLILSPDSAFFKYFEKGR